MKLMKFIAVSLPLIDNVEGALDRHRGIEARADGK